MLRFCSAEASRRRAGFQVGQGNQRMPIDPPDSVERERVHTTICGKQGGIPMAGDSLFLYPFSMQKRCANDANLVDLWIVGGDHLLMDVKCGILHC